MFLIELTYLVPWEVVQQHVVAHREFLDRYYRAGTLLVSGPLVSKTGGVILSLQQQRSEVEAMIEHDPFAREQIARYTIREFSGVKRHALLADLAAPL